MDLSEKVSTPMETGVRFVKDGVANGPVSKAVDKPYRELIGSLMYAMTGTRPDIAFAVVSLSRFNEAPKLAHWRAAKRVLAYLANTVDLGLIFEGNNSISGFSDADFGGCIESRKSVSGLLVMSGTAPVIWKSTKQTTVAESTTEAEFVACSLFSREIMWVRSFMSELGKPIAGPVTMFVDNKSTINLVQNQQVHSKIKHIDIKLMAVRQRQDAGAVKLEYARSENQLADIMTKSLAPKNFFNLRKLLGLMMLLSLAAIIDAISINFKPSDLLQTSPLVKGRLVLKIRSPCVQGVF